MIGPALPTLFWQGPELIPAATDGFRGVVQPLDLGIGCALLLLAAFGACASAALIGCSHSKLRKVLSGDEADATLEYLRDYDLQLRVLARLLTIAAASGALLVTGMGVRGALGNLVFGVFSVAAVFLVAVLPAAVATNTPERAVLRLLPVLRPIHQVLRFPLLVPLLWASRPFLRALKIPEVAQDSEEIADEILAAVEDSAAGKLAEEEQAWIGNIVALKELHASEVMTPRTDIHALVANLPLQDAIQLAVANGHSRFPVYEDSIDDVVGVFYAKDILSRIANGQDIASMPVGQLTRKPLFAPESMRVSDLLREFKTSKVQMAIVIDEYGGTAGLITIEDVLEEIVGDIEDEFDPEAQAPIEVIEEERVLEVSGKTRVEEANTALNFDWIPEGEDYDTVGGFVFSHLGQIPVRGERFQVGGLEFTALEVDNRRVKRVRLAVLSSQATDP